ncbi:queuosine precursor transporter [Chromobacterium subtsugae]|uniref:Queuosine precursor transporter n=1 Tax=Chromobacterium subtsugae TaxID=251747 RepID=A0ABS7FDY7_9NEIS|nr:MULTISPECIES: queuosine precursor transporter [Chromobacterium]KUM03884.1 hypothetical protein Cv017_17685 [Chromobacterium subtsugae]KZE87455.1 hypothetical protein AWB61_11325 [Chromobacterium sp. F49]MBW7566604.1 queuosine precursor transporter [Chromobacterium subtsugae]MBW8288291.1 queuosine precursor transporter [Chromobacterium subtsugae]OBU87260.1 hypothetical protein MY55_07160 [Chromobacterium subtsugae]
MRTIRELAGKSLAAVDPIVILSFLILISAIVSNLTSYKVIQIFGTEASLGTFTMPIILMLLNPIAEVYGKNRSNQILFATCLAEIVFAVSFTALSQSQRDCGLLPLAERDHCAALNQSYVLISEHIVRGSISFALGCLIGSQFNTRFLLYLKRLWSSRFYFVRDVFSSVIGEVVYTAICFMIAFYGVFPFATIVKIFAFSLMFKFSSTVLLSWISQYIVQLLYRYQAWLEPAPSSKKIKFSSRYLQV